MHLAKIFALFGYTIFFPFPSHPVPSQRLYEDTCCPFIPVDMARRQAKSNIKNKGRQPLVVKDQRKQSQGIKKQAAVRKSARLQAIENLRKQFTSKSNHTREIQTSPSPPISNVPIGRKALQHPHVLHSPPEPPGKRKREQDAGHRSSQPRDQPPPKRLRTPPSSCIVEENLHQGAASNTNENSPDPLQYWVLTGSWRKEYFEQDSQVRDDFERGKSPDDLEQKGWLREDYVGEPFNPMHSFHPLQYLFAKRKSSSSLRRKNSQSSIQTPSDQQPREVKSAQYRNPDYEIRLEEKGSYMRRSALGITDTSKDLCRTLLGKEQTVPQNTLFRDDLFDETCESVQGRNEAMVVRDVSPLICPSAQVLRILGAKHLNYLYESVNEGWNSAIAFEGTRPQPDYSVGFGRSAFTQEHLTKLKPFVGEPGYKALTYFMATTRMYFPFLTSEVKCGAAALDIADRQNTHSMTVAVRALVELFRSVKREKELDREILAFSISHDHKSVRIYGHYPVVEGEGNKTTFYRHPIRAFDFTEQDGKDKWATYKFTKNIYDIWMPSLHKRICSAINDLPAGINFDLSQSASFSQSTPQSSQESNAESILGEDDSQSSFLASQEVTPNTLFTQATEPAFKKPKNQRAGGQRQ